MTTFPRHDILPFIKETKEKGPITVNKIPIFSKNFWREQRSACILLLAAALIFILCCYLAAPETEEDSDAEEYAEYERCTVVQILTDNTEQDPASDDAWRGDQLMLVEVKTGQYAGETLQVSNYVGPLYGAPLEEGDNAVVLISTYADGSHIGSIFEYDRILPLAVIVLLFIIATALVGGKVGVKSLISLALTLACMLLILIPALMKGAPTLLTVFLVCAYITVVTMTILGGLQKKTVCAMLGTIAGIATALLFGLLAQHLTRIDGLRISDVEPLLQMRQTGTPIGLRGLLTGGIVISALGAVMDVAMSISSSLTEVSAANPSLGRKELFRSGMNIGRDMVGTMTNTLILAFFGSSFTMILYLYTLGLSSNQLLSSAYLSIEVISSISSSIGMILSIPITALIASAALGKNS